MLAKIILTLCCVFVGFGFNPSYGLDPNTNNEQLLNNVTLNDNVKRSVDDTNIDISLYNDFNLFYYGNVNNYYSNVTTTINNYTYSRIDTTKSGIISNYNSDDKILYTMSGEYYIYSNSSIQCYTDSTWLFPLAISPNTLTLINTTKIKVKLSTDNTSIMLISKLQYETINENYYGNEFYTDNSLELNNYSYYYQEFTISSVNLFNLQLNLSLIENYFKDIDYYKLIIMHNNLLTDTYVLDSLLDVCIQGTYYKYINFNNIYSFTIQCDVNDGKYLNRLFHIYTDNSVNVSFEDSFLFYNFYDKNEDYLTFIYYTKKYWNNSNGLDLTSIEEDILNRTSLTRFNLEKFAFSFINNYVALHNFASKGLVATKDLKFVYSKYDYYIYSGNNSYDYGAHEYAEKKSYFTNDESNFFYPSNPLDDKSTTTFLLSFSLNCTDTYISMGFFGFDYLSSSNSESYQNGYKDGQVVGYNNGYNYGVKVANETQYTNGYNAGVSSVDTNSYYDNGYNVGYNVGYSDGVTSEPIVTTLFTSVVDVPINILNGLFDVEIFNTSLLKISLSLLAFGLVLWAIKKVI